MLNFEELIQKNKNSGKNILTLQVLQYYDKSSYLSNTSQQQKRVDNQLKSESKEALFILMNLI